LTYAATSQTFSVLIKAVDADYKANALTGSCGFELGGIKAEDFGTSTSDDDSLLFSGLKKVNSHNSLPITNDDVSANFYKSSAKFSIGFHESGTEITSLESTSSSEAKADGEFAWDEDSKLTVTFFIHASLFSVKAELKSSFNPSQVLGDRVVFTRNVDQETLGVENAFMDKGLQRRNTVEAGYTYSNTAAPEGYLPALQGTGLSGFLRTATQL
jgi:hypothetical protein